MSTESDRAIEPTEIEITPEMIEAGIAPLFRFHHDKGNEAEIVKEIFRAMLLVHLEH